MNNGKKLSKILTIVLTVITVIIGVIAAAIIVNVIVCRIRRKPVSFFGNYFAIVQTPSMEPEIMTGDLIVYGSCKYADVEVGDVIVFIAGNGFPEDVRNKNIVHEAIEITTDGIRTKGVHNDSADTDLVTEENLLGICTGNSTFWGAVFRAFQKYGIIIIIAIIAVPFIVSQIIKIIKLSKQPIAAVTEDNVKDAEDNDLLPKNEKVDNDDDIKIDSKIDNM